MIVEIGDRNGKEIYMREIIYRGIDCKTGECLIGSLLIRDGKPFIYLDHHGLHIEVLPETVEQYTGLVDRNEKKIFEGDILRLVMEYRRFEDDDIQYRTIIVRIYYSNGAFWFSGNGYTDCLWHFYNARNREIIGNIRNNPELLEKK